VWTSFFSCRVGRRRGIVTVGGVVVNFWSCRDCTAWCLIAHAADKRLRRRVLDCRRVDRRIVGRASGLFKVAAGLPKTLPAVHKDDLIIVGRIGVYARYLNVDLVVDVPWEGVLVVVDDIRKLASTDGVVFLFVTIILEVDVQKSIVVAFLQYAGGPVKGMCVSRLSSDSHSQRTECTRESCSSCQSLTPRYLRHHHTTARCIEPALVLNEVVGPGYDRQHDVISPVLPPQKLRPKHHRDVTQMVRSGQPLALKDLGDHIKLSLETIVSGSPDHTLTLQWCLQSVMRSQGSYYP
jgi:hypothetical protein